jgi:carboxylesterase
MDVIAGAEPFQQHGSSVGVVISHGFTGSPASVRPWAQHLADADYGVDVPLLPGHGTSWQQLNGTHWRDWYGTIERSMLSMAERYDIVVAAGLSMGGCLALRLAQEHGSIVDGLLLVNPIVSLKDPRLRLLPVLRYLTPAVKAIGNDIAKPGQDEVAYDRTPLHALYTQTALWRLVREDLPRVSQPIRIFQSDVDHVLDQSSVQLITKGVSSSDVRRIPLPRSYHVATLDYDAPTIFAESVEFIQGLVSQRREVM